jgi:hypothetical protein
MSHSLAFRELKALSKRKLQFDSANNTTNMKRTYLPLLAITAVLCLCESSAMAAVVSVPDAGSTAIMLLLGLAGFGMIAKRLRK